ncbi:hypothetical protein VNO77_04129 [Canavalia gladiata]|uniref:Uncharacterized protein n=1 Tax=Canavalia gladiata TaxID=3824 RepID=A0AAN9N154_CANGL
MRVDSDFFSVPLPRGQRPSNKYEENRVYAADRWSGKTNFVEIRTFWHVFRSFDNMWSFYILCLQAIIIIAWNGFGQLTSIFDGDVFKKVLSIFITVAILNLHKCREKALYNSVLQHQNACFVLHYIMV